MFQKDYHIHFVGIGGIGMSGIAELLLNLGYRVSGSDLQPSDITRRLETLGAVLHEGHKEAYITGSDVVVISSAVGPENVEVVAAQQAAIPVIPRAEMLAELMRLKYSIAIAGAHGKTSTTSIVASVLTAGGLDPTVVVGGKLKSTATNAMLGDGDYIVAEADESDGSFLKMAPTIAVVTNIDREHLDFYRDLNEIQDAFVRFVHRIPFYGLAVLCLDNEAVQEIIPKIAKRFTTYGLSTQADFQARSVMYDGLKSRFSVYHGERKLGGISLNLPGSHNVSNAMASISVGTELGIPFPTIKGALETLEGVQRRQELKGTAAGITVIDDYGHHPTEIKATLQAMKSSWPEKRIAVLFQPHRYTRTQALFDEFTRAFYQSDLLVVLPIYPAGEKEIPGLDSRKLFRGIKEHGHKAVAYAESKEIAVSHLLEALQPGDLLLTLGAGDVWKAGEAILSELAEKRGAPGRKLAE